ncbi:FAD:protein FMN transferase [Paenibacillus cremeus]|uniref:FAD:protein FMN transferase n=1 Tax=Paenibacillus cremeus TaxID=2163881 RepID=A0A559K775_9BACL|nr:FAD:protein FMN transferase [Paenibacillus cremeus]TVY07933.1 FAD:protein FMN transferase [Paenibacillus cremeus]
MRRTKLYMDTVVDIQVIPGNSEQEAEARIRRAFDAFRKVEDTCSRFSPDSELMAACRQIMTPVPVSPLLFELLCFALQFAEWTGGIFDPAVGKVMEEYGFNRHYLTGQSIQSPAADHTSYRDILLNEQDRTVYLCKPLVIDLGAIAKGFAIDLAAKELEPFDGFIVNAGGDLYAGGHNDRGEPWEIGIQHPTEPERILYKLSLSNEAVCTSGSYERKSATNPEIHHLIHPTSKYSPNTWVSCSVVAPFAMLADAASTASFVYGPEAQTFIENMELKGVLVTPDLQIVTVGGI